MDVVADAQIRRAATQDLTAGRLDGQGDWSAYRRDHQGQGAHCELLEGLEDICRDALAAKPSRDRCRGGISRRPMDRENDRRRRTGMDSLYVLPLRPQAVLRFCLCIPSPDALGNKMTGAFRGFSCRCTRTQMSTTGGPFLGLSNAHTALTCLSGEVSTLSIHPASAPCGHARCGHLTAHLALAAPQRNTTFRLDIGHCGSPNLLPPVSKAETRHSGSTVKHRGPLCRDP